MTSKLLASAAALAITAASAQAELTFTPGEGPFSWDSYNGMGGRRP